MQMQSKLAFLGLNSSKAREMNREFFPPTIAKQEVISSFFLKGWLNLTTDLSIRKLRT